MGNDTDKCISLKHRAIIQLMHAIRMYRLFYSVFSHSYAGGLAEVSIHDWLLYVLSPIELLINLPLVEYYAVWL